MRIWRNINALQRLNYFCFHPAILTECLITRATWRACFELSSAEKNLLLMIYILFKSFSCLIIGHLSFGCKKIPENYLGYLGQENIQEKYFVVTSAVGGKLKTEYFPTRFYDYSKQVKYERSWGRFLKLW